MTGSDAPDRTLDGSAAAGPLAELFAIDLSAAVVQCGGCGARATLAAHDVYPDAPALVVRCRRCTGVVLRYCSDARGLRLEMTGTRLLIVPAR